MPDFEKSSFQNLSVTQQMTGKKNIFAILAAFWDFLFEKK
jgi:hypothetical protein